MPPIRLMATTGILGYGFTEEAFNAGVAMKPDLIACDAGSTDPGPHYLGSGTAFVSRAAVKRDLGLMVAAGAAHGIPVMIGTAGGSGSDVHVDWVLDILREICAENDLAPKIAVIRTEQSKDRLHEKLAAGKIAPLGPIGELTGADIDDAVRVVAMMGPEAYQEALADGADVVIAGRGTDAALFAALPLMRGADPGLSWHLAKIIECGAQVVEPREGQDCVIGTIYDDHFTVEPGHPDRRCTVTRVSAHTLYENPEPFRLKEPDGTLVTDRCDFEQIEERVVKVSGSRYEPSDTYTVKLEGARQVGFRTVFIAGIRDPILIAGIDDFVRSCRERIQRDVAALGIAPGDFTLSVHLYGKNAVMGELEPQADAPVHELGLLLDVLGRTEDISRAVLAKSRYAFLHTDFPGRMCISGNLAIPFSPSDMHVGPVYEFNIWHVMACDDPMECVRMEWIEPEEARTWRN
ncbi:MAG: acyclic terpene utilization AtuA family protein [Rhodospirillales bacterium]|nr:acyclic terpene utilization AtuA family protein [Rhodospirillales bacterium]MBO6786775.1 acyclic terpene utilization AtuA family protein [Rhodospirillales bacterium]